jgi:predicted nucleotide-binding protein (sugar kinase/HSP70/actin superfamily)
VEAGLEMNLDFFLGMLNAMLIGDLVNELAYQVRPYEVEPGATDRALTDSMTHLEEVFRRHAPWKLDDSWKGRWAARLTGSPASIESLGKFVEQLRGDTFTNALRWVRERFDQVEVDRLRPRPIVKITGEFWAQTTEGDGNFNMFPFLEREGAEVLVEPIATWIMYMIHQAKQKQRDRRGLLATVPASGIGRVRERVRDEAHHRSVLARLTLAERLFASNFGRLQEALGGTCHGLTDQYELQRVGHPYYNSRAGGGEGHLEVAKNIYYSAKGLCHMVLSLKPFGCMPSTQSDGVQAAVVNHYKDIIYLAIETSGEGEVNAHSRVQMALGEAKMRAKQEFAETVARTGYTLEMLRDHVAAHPELRRPLSTPVVHADGSVGVGAAFALQVAAHMRARGVRG